MIAFPNSKINIGLNVVSKRQDGYHNLETIFYPISLCDSLEIVESQQDSLCTYGFEIAGDVNHNLVVKALKLMREYAEIPPQTIHLSKTVPMGAGLGGGSADASYMLRMLNEKYAVGMTNEKLEELAAKLGADCDVFIKNKPTFATGIGNVFSSVEVNLNGYFLVVVKPEVNVPTAKAFSLIRPKSPTFDLKESVKLPIEKWKDFIKNDFEESVFYHYPEIERIKDRLYEYGALYASMSGSGASVYGIFNEKVDLKTKFLDCFYWSEYL